MLTNGVRRVIRGCPSWPLSAAYRASIGTSTTTYWYPGYGETTFIRKQTLPGPYIAECLVYDPVYVNCTAVEVPRSLVSHPAQRPFFMDCQNASYWAEWYPVPGSATNQQMVDSVQRHRGLANVMFFDGHIERIDNQAIIVAQDVPR